MSKFTREKMTALGDKAWEEFISYADDKGVAELIGMLPEHIVQFAKTAMRSGVAYGYKQALTDTRPKDTLQ